MTTTVDPMRLLLGLLAACLMAGSPALPGLADERVRYVRFADGGTAKLGRLEGDTIHVLDGSLFGTHTRTGETRPLAAVRLLPPVRPRKVLAVASGARRGDAGAGEPELFAKLPTSVIGPGDPIPYPADATDLHVQGALVVVIGKRGRNISVDAAPDHIFGVTAGADVGERGWQARDLQWLRARASDGFAPIGPVLVRGIGWRDLAVETRLNGKPVPRVAPAKASHDVAAVISFASRYITLEPGDIVFMGAPGAVGPGQAWRRGGGGDRRHRRAAQPGRRRPPGSARLGGGRAAAGKAAGARGDYRRGGDLPVGGGRSRRRRGGGAALRADVHQPRPHRARGRSQAETAPPGGPGRRDRFVMRRAYDTRLQPSRG